MFDKIKKIVDVLILSFIIFCVIAGGVMVLTDIDILGIIIIYLISLYLGYMLSKSLGGVDV